MSEKIKNENTEADGKNEVSKLVYGVKIKDSSDPIIASSVAEEFKNFFMDEARVFLPGESDRNIITLSAVSAIGICKGVAEFIKTYIKKKGKISFTEGYGIGNKAMDLDGKK